MRTAPLVLGGVLQPDLRHWEHVPAAVVITRGSDLTAEEYLPLSGAQTRRFSDGASHE
ncbi:MAG: hypothetical protein HY348_01375 [Nitrospira defluvii]|nr:hypothetical protein [Nitrospira defluvii]